MGWITKIIILILLLAALYNWDLWCSNPHIAYVDESSTTYLGRAAFCLFIALMIMVYEVNIYFASRKDEEYTP